METTPTTKHPAHHDAHIRAHDDRLVRITTGARDLADFVSGCKGDYRPSVYPGLSGSRLADVLDAEFKLAGRSTRCWRGPLCPGDDVEARDAWIEAQIGGAL
jgi:hypothetical protein